MNASTPGRARARRVLFVLVTVCATCRPAWARSYTVTDLPTLGGTPCNVVNNSGTVVGGSTTASGATHAFSYSNGAMTDFDATKDRPVI